MLREFSDSELNELEQIIGYTFEDRTYLKAALTHPSSPGFNSMSSKITHDRLEFLGNSVMSLIVADRAFEKLANIKEGGLRRLRAKLLKEGACAIYFRSLDLNRFIRMSTSEKKHLESIGNDRIMTDLIRALIGAIYKDGGLNSAIKFFNGKCLPAAKSLLKDRHHSNWRRKLQEICQKKMRKLPNYILLSEEGPEHSRVYKVGVFMNDDLLAKGEGKTKKIAASIAAEKALEKIS